MNLDFTTSTDGPELFLPPGRFHVPYDEARSLLVDHPRFRDSDTRRDIWEGFEDYLARFFGLEEHFSDALEGEPLIHRIWLGGSYVSSKVNPSNIDVAVLINAPGEKRIKGKPKAGWMTKAFDRDVVLPEFRVSSLRISYRPVRSVFKSKTLPADDQDYLRERGAWDDWWQRCRPPGAKGAPTLESAGPRRGYLEVAP
ncbi:hypothetical protein GTY86_16725 [Streptomyces sp. SID5770]|uniref:DUF6932 family protein n=1 Tax=Streptomyces sp. SID5770 TaxID=2690308 RepID=UPI00136DDD93|nr:hypothetical protein [Streptomyces sp. SID5770]MZE52898.1 hypothetical protein [Streptomyces sp. SID5770]